MLRNGVLLSKQDVNSDMWNYCKFAIEQENKVRRKVWPNG